MHATHHFLSISLLIHTCRKLRTGSLIHILNYVRRCLTLDTCSMLNSPNTGLFQSSGASRENHPLCRARGWVGGPPRVHIPRVPGHRQNLPYFPLLIVHNTVYSVFAVLLSIFFRLFSSTLRFESVLGCCREQVLGPLPDRVRCLLARTSPD